LNSGDVIASKYLLERPLAKGGMGAVWVARHLELDVRVALKVMAPEHVDTAFARDRFHREARACAQIRSPHVVAVHDYGVADGVPFLVMELLEGEDLQACLAREGRLSLATAASVLLPVCKGLRRAHELGIIHRDIKPSNVFLARQGEELTVKILDFGVARITHDLASPMTRTGTLLGSPGYMSPEQARGRRVDHRSDLWSLAVVLYECLTGRPPFVSQAIGDLLVEVCTEPIPLPTTLAPHLPAVVDTFFARALARNPDERFQTADAFAEALAALGSASPNLELGPPGAGLHGRETVDMPPAHSPTVPGIARTIGGSRPRATRLALAILVPIVLGLGVLAAYRVSAPNPAPDRSVAAPAEPPAPPPPLQMPPEPTAPTASVSSTAAPEPPAPPEPAPSTSKPAETPRQTAPSRAPRPPSKSPSPPPPSPSPSRDPTFGF